jgi:hypothetical protein
MEYRGVRCNRHSMDITTTSIFTFCTHLSLINDHEQPGGLVRNNNLIGQDMYIWVQIGYTTQEYPGLPQYHQEFERLSTIPEYSSWSVEQRQKAVRAIDELKEREFREKYGGVAQPEWQGRMFAWVMKLLHRIFK